MNLAEQHFESIFGKTPEEKVDDMIKTSARLETRARIERDAMRDDIAIRVLIAMIETTPKPIDYLATFPINAYQFADAMMAAREGQVPKAATSVAVKITGEGGGGPGGQWPDGFNEGVRVQFIGNDPAHRGTVIAKGNRERNLVVVQWDRGPATWESTSTLRIIGDDE